MKMIFKSILLLLTLSSFLTTPSVQSQPNTNDLNNMHKYWYYRERLKHFVIPGCNYAESNMAGITNRNMNSIGDGSGRLDFGQNGVYFGYYLGILATEYYLLSANNQISAAQSTELEIVAALEQYINYMDKSEHFWVCNGTPQGDTYNGFFTRQSIPQTFLNPNDEYGLTLTTPNATHLDIINRDLTPLNKFQINGFVGLNPGHPGYYSLENVNSADELVSGYLDKPRCSNTAPYDEVKEVTMNQDEGSGMLMGLALIYKYMKTSMAIVNYTGMNCKETARDIALKITNKICQDKHWRVETPCGDGIWDCQYYSYGWARAAHDFFDGPEIVATYFDNVVDAAWYEAIWWAVREANPMVINGNNVLFIASGWVGFIFLPDITLEQPTYNSVMSSILAAIGDSWDLISDKTYQGLVYSNTDIQAQSFYTLLYKTLHPEKEIQEDEIILMNAQLLNAPGEGPYYYGLGLHPPSDGWSGGWSSTYRWRQETDIQINGSPDFEGNYSGCDYMLAYNMWLISGYGDYANVKTFYHPYEDIIVDHFIPFHHTIQQKNMCNYLVPLTYHVYNSITSNMEILNSTRYDQDHQLLTTPIESLYGSASFTARKSVTLTPGFFAEKGATFCAKIAPDHFFWTTFGINNSGYDQSHAIGGTSNYLTTPCYNPPEPTDGPSVLKTGDQSPFDKDNSLPLNLFPNPVFNKLNIVFNDKQKQHSLRLSTATGLTLCSFDSENEAEIVDMSTLMAGVYFIQISCETTTVTCKVIKN